MGMYQLRFSGTGGQGMMLIGDLMAYCLGMKEEKEIVLLKSYGPEARGGACRSELIVSDDKIAYPVITCPTLMLAMSQLAYDSYLKDTDENTIIIIDSDLVENVNEENENVYKLPLTNIAKESTGKAICANIVALGAICKISGYTSKEKMLETLEERMPAKIKDINMLAFAAGYKAVEE